jgi:hypothetical protein
MPRPDRAVDHGRRLADQGACVPWDALAAIERAQADAAARRTLASDRGGERGERGGETSPRGVRHWLAIGRSRLSRGRARRT